MSQKAPEFIDITPQVRDCVAKADVHNGFVVVFSKAHHSRHYDQRKRAALAPRMEQFLDRIAPRDGSYQHNNFLRRTVNLTADESPNGHAHCQNLLFHTSETIPIVQSCPQFGRWQCLFL